MVNLHFKLKNLLMVMYIVSNGRHKIKPQKSSGMVFGGVNGGKD